MALAAPAFADPASASTLRDYTIPHFEFHLVVDFDTSRVFGCVDLRVAWRGSAYSPAPPAQLILDSHDSLSVACVTIHDGSTHLAWSQAPFTSFGAQLVVDVSPLTAELTTHPVHIRIHYSAGPGPALCWLTPAQTAGKTHPYLFTQGQATLNRSLLPCMDSPSVRSTWRGNLLVKLPHRAVMSAVQAAPDGRPGREVLPALLPYITLPAGSKSAPFPLVDVAEYRLFTGSMATSVPVYLVAMAVGDIASVEIGPRSRVWAEPSVLSRAQFEFGHDNVTEKYLTAGEDMFGPYQWQQYDIVVMPPSFPYGGMENPVATFCTPALLAGDQSLTDVIAHEIAHSWTGNLVTNSSWSHFFLNEGFTMYLQRRITSRVDAVEGATALETVSGRALLRRAMLDYSDKPELTRLVVPLADGIDPDETYTETPYEKGFAFVSYLRACVGSDEAFDAWLRTYTTEYSFCSIAAVDMLSSFFRAFPQFQGDWTAAGWLQQEAEEASQWWAVSTPVPAADDLDRFGVLPPLPSAPAAASSDANPASQATVPIVDAKGRTGLAYRPGYEFMRWMHAPGWPPYYPSLEKAKALSEPADELLHSWLRGTPAPVTPAVFATWPTGQKVHFLDGLLAAAEADAEACAVGAGTVTHALLAALDSAYSFSVSGNAELRLRWAQATAVAVWPSGMPALEDFLTMTGKLKYATPVFRACIHARALPSGERPMRVWATAAYARLRPTFHAAVQSRVDGVFSAAGGVSE